MEASRADAVSVHNNQALSTISGADVKSSRRPDVAIVRSDGKIDVVEVRSPRQSAQNLIDNHTAALGERAGVVKTVELDPGS